MLHVYIHISNMPFSIGQSRLQKPAFGPQTQSRQTNTSKKQYIQVSSVLAKYIKIYLFKKQLILGKNDVTYPLVN